MAINYTLVYETEQIATDARSALQAQISQLRSKLADMTQSKRQIEGSGEVTKGEIDAITRSIDRLQNELDSILSVADLTPAQLVRYRVYREQIAQLVRYRVYREQIKLQNPL